MSWKSQDYVNVYQQKRQYDAQNRIADEIAKQNTAMQKQMAAVQRKMERMERQQQEQREAQEIESRIYRLVDQEEALTKLNGVFQIVDQLINQLPDTGGEIDITLPEALTSYVSKVGSLVADIESKVSSLTMVSIASFAQNKLDNLVRISRAATALTGLIVEIRTFHQFLSQHPLSDINNPKTRVADYVVTGNVGTSREELSASIVLMKEYIAAAEIFLKNSDCYKADKVPPLVCSLRKTASEITTTGNSFWQGAPESDHIGLIECSLALGDYLANSHDTLEAACQTLTEFNSRHNEKNPVDVRKIPESITTARNTLAEVAKILDKMTKDANAWPQVQCFTNNLSYANQYREAALEVQKEYDLLPKNTYSGLAIFSLVLGILSIVCTFFSGIPAAIVGHMALARMKWHRGRAIAIAGLFLGYLMSGIGIVKSFNTHMTKVSGPTATVLFDEKTEPKKVQEVVPRTPAIKEVMPASATPVPDETLSCQQEAVLASQFYARRATDPTAEATALEHLKKAIGETVHEKKDITGWEGCARFQLASIYFQKQDMNRARKLLDVVFDNDSWENPSETASSFRLLKAKVAEAEGDPKRACESYSNYFRPKLAKKAFDAEDREVFVKAWKLAIENRESVNLATFCCYKGSAVEGIIAGGDEATIKKIRDMLKSMAGSGYSQWIEDIDRALSPR